jgi:flagellar FliL protein
LYIAIAFIALSGGGGAWWYLERDAAPGTARPQPPKPPVFAPLDTFTVNLQAEDGNQFLQIGLTLRLVDDAATAALKLRMPEVRDRILLLLSAKKASDLLTLEGKRKLSAEIQAAVNAILVPGSVQPTAASAGARTAPAAASSATSPATASATSAPAPSGDAPGDVSSEQQAGTLQAAPGTGADTAAAPPESAAGESAQATAAAAQPVPSTPSLPVTGVLFTSFIIQ